jgi:hypothetical protein
LLTALWKRLNINRKLATNDNGSVHNDHSAADSCRQIEREQAVQSWCQQMNPEATHTPELCCCPQGKVKHDAGFRSMQRNRLSGSPSGML